MSQPARDPATTAARASRLRGPAALAVLVFLLPGAALFALYAPALDYEYAWTDTTAIAAGTMLRPRGEIHQAFREPLHRIPRRGAAAQQTYYRPLQVVGLSLVADRFGPSPRHFRLAGLAVGALCLGLFSLLAGRLLGNPLSGLVAALAVALHPVGIETYVWIAGTSGALCAAFTVAALALGLACCRPGPSRAAALYGAASLLAVFGALLSKERALVEPLLLVALLASASRLGALDRRRGAWLLAGHAAVAAAAFFGLRQAVLGTTHVALPPIGGSAVSHVASAVANWPDSLGWMLVPWQSSTSDVIRWAHGPTDPRFGLGAALALASAAAWWQCLRRGHPVAALGIAWIWIAFAPTSGLLPMLHANGERYLFLSAFGAALVLADGWTALRRRSGLAVAAVVALLPLAFLGQRTAARLPDWQSNLELFQGEIARDPAFREGYFLVAAELFDAGRYDRAAETLAAVRSAGPAFEGTSSYLNPLATAELTCAVELARGRHDAVVALEDELQRTRPWVLRAPSVRTCVGQAHNARGDTERALQLYLAAADDLKSEAPSVLYVMIARNYLRLGQAAESAAWLARARAAGDPALAAQIRRLESKLPAAAP